MYMRRLFKRMAAAVLVSACLVSLSACSKTEEETESLSISMDGTPVEDAMGQSLLLSAAQTLGASDEQLVVQGKLAQSQGDTVSAELYQAQLDVREEMGALRSVDIEDGSVVLLEDGSYTVILPVEFAEGTKKYVMNLNMATQQIQAQFTDMSAGVEEDSSIGGLLRTASVYTLIGLGTVFCVLVFISLLISSSMHGKKDRRIKRLIRRQNLRKLLYRLFLLHRQFLLYRQQDRSWQMMQSL